MYSGKYMRSLESNPIEPSELTYNDGLFLVKLARQAIEKYVAEGVKIEPPKDTPEKLTKPGMAFVTIERYGEIKELRGCIGFLQPITPLVKTVINAAIAAATEDPRFPPLSKDELDNIVIEVSILSMPRQIKSINDIVVGKHGLIVSRGWYNGTLLPQVPIEYCWDRETFLAECCLKAGLDPDCWLDPRTRIYVYEAVIFYEEDPRSTIKMRNLLDEYKMKCAWLLEPST